MVSWVKKLEMPLLLQFLQAFQLHIDMSLESFFGNDLAVAVIRVQFTNSFEHLLHLVLVKQIMASKFLLLPVVH